VSQKLASLVLCLFLSTATVVRSQQAVSSITQARLFPNPAAPGTASVDANGTALADEESASDSGDESFGNQIILKNQERRRLYTVFADVSAFHTNNVDLTPSGTRSDTFLASSVGVAWRPAIRQDLIADLSAGTSLFRYDRATELDFEKLWAGAGVSWAVPRAAGIIAFGRYDFTEVLDASSRELLQDHTLSVGAQKIFVFGRSHYLATGLTGILGFSRPSTEQRDQVAIHGAYHLQITRSLDVDLIYRYAVQFYNDDGRIDRNQTLSLAMGVAATHWLRVTGAISAARNDSNESASEYDVFNLGGGLKLEFTF
jgi:signal transduction histidine kinase